MTKEQAIKAYTNGKDIRIIINGAWHSAMQTDAEPIRYWYAEIHGAYLSEANRRAYIMHKIDDLVQAYTETDGRANIAYEILVEETPEW